MPQESGVQMIDDLLVGPGDLGQAGEPEDERIRAPHLIRRRRMPACDERRRGDYREAVADRGSLQSDVRCQCGERRVRDVPVPDVGGDLFASLDHLLASTTDVVVATGILNIWMHTAAETGAWRAGLSEPDRDRVLLGIGISHAMLIDAQPGMSWDKPLATTRSYLEAMDAAGIPAEARVVAALGPKMLDLARDRAGGAHPYLVTPEHTRLAREVLGEGRLLAATTWE